MRYPASTPLQFSGAQAFVEQHGDRVWSEICDTYPTGKLIYISQIAADLECLKHYKSHRSRYVRAVLKAIQADIKERPEAYADMPLPFTTEGKNLHYIIL